MKAIVLATLLVLGTPAFAQQPSADTESPRLIVRRDSHRHYRGESARLIIHRIPNLGVNVIVDLWIDGVVAGPIGYGHTFDGYISAGPHVITLLPTPNGLWKQQTNIPVNFRGGETYNFTAASDHSGRLILLGGPGATPVPVNY
jgi:hypothetical protein